MADENSVVCTTIASILYSDWSDAAFDAIWFANIKMRFFQTIVNAVQQSILGVGGMCWRRAISESLTEV